jgi:hypothetical protein
MIRADPALKELLMLEYEKVKDEQRARIAIRENLFYTALIIIGGAFSALLTMSGLEVGYLVLTPILFVISTVYYYNDEIIGRMNLYIREDLRPRMAAASGVAKDEIFRWETFTRETHRIRRRLYQFAANLILYPGASSVALAFFALRRGAMSEPEQLAIVVCAMMTLLMLIQVFRHADLFSRR